MSGFFFFSKKYALFLGSVFIGWAETGGSGAGGLCWRITCWFTFYSTDQGCDSPGVGCRSAMKEPVVPGIRLVFWLVCFCHLKVNWSRTVACLSKEIADCVWRIMCSQTHSTSTAPRWILYYIRRLPYSEETFCVSCHAVITLVSAVLDIFLCKDIVPRKVHFMHSM